MALALKDLLKGVKSGEEAKKIIEKKNYKVTAQDIIAMRTPDAGPPSFPVCVLMLKHGNQKQKDDTVKFLVGNILDSMIDREYVDKASEALLEYFSEQTDGLEKV